MYSSQLPCLIPPPSPLTSRGNPSSLPGSTPKPDWTPFRFHPYSLGTQTENVEPPSWWLTPPPSTTLSTSHSLVLILPTVLFSSPQSLSSSRPPGELSQNCHPVMPSSSAQFSSPEGNGRFVSLLPGQELEQLCKLYVPKQTKNNSSWAVGIFRAWAATRNASPDVHATDAVPGDILKVRYPLHVIDRTLAF